MTDEQRSFLMKAFGVTGRMLRYALSYDPNKDTDLARRIRSLALQRGGHVYCTAPESEVIHCSDGKMRQYFESGAMWEADKETGVLEVKTDDGTVLERIENATIRDIELVQKRLGSMRAVSMW